MRPLLPIPRAATTRRTLVQPGDQQDRNATEHEPHGQSFVPRLDVLLLQVLGAFGGQIRMPPRRQDSADSEAQDAQDGIGPGLPPGAISIAHYPRHVLMNSPDATTCAAPRIVSG